MRSFDFNSSLGKKESTVPSSSLLLGEEALLSLGIAPLEGTSDPEDQRGEEGHGGDEKADGTAPNIRTLVAGEFSLLREGLKSVVSNKGLGIVAETHRFEEVPQLARSTDSEVALLATWNSAAPATLLESFRDLPPSCKGMCLLPSAGYKLNSTLLEAKANVPCLPITSAPEKIVFTILRAVRAGNEKAKASRRLGHEQLTIREMEVLGILARGKRNEEIARSLFVTTATVKAHLTSIYRKLEVESRAEALALYSHL